MVQGPGQRDTDTPGSQHPARLPVPDKPPHLPGRRLHDRLRPRTEVQRGASLGDHRAGQVDEDRPQFVAVQVEADRVACLGDQAQDRAGLAARRGAAPGLRGKALGPQPGGDLADRLRREPGALGQLQAADARLARPAQQVKYERGVVAAQRRQVHSGVGPVHVRLHRAIVLLACTLATPLLKWKT